MRTSVFISYRREGGEGFAQMFSEKLTKKRYHVFYDIESIGAGLFDQRILQEIEQTDVFLLILTKNALDRCLNDGDWVRCEIAHALKMGKPIIPLFFRGFEFPEDLPADIEKVALYNGVDIRDMNFLDSKFKQLCTMINEAAKKSRTAAPVIRRTEEAAVSAPVVSAPEKAPDLAPNNKPMKDVDVWAKKAERYYRKAKKGAVRYYLRAAELGHSGALKWLAEHIYEFRSLTAKGLFKNTQLARMREAYGRGRDARAYFARAEDNDSLIICWGEATRRMMKAAEMGYIPAQMAMGDWYARNHTYNFDTPARKFIYEYKKPDYQHAFYWFMQVAEQGVGAAHYELGRLFESGDGVNKNLKQAVHHYRLAAMKGDADGQYSLGRCLAEGKGVPVDRIQAAHWYKLAAAQGHTDAQSAQVGLIE